MKAILSVLVGVIFGVLGDTVVKDHFAKPAPVRQIVCMITPYGPVFGEASPTEDVMADISKVINESLNGAIKSAKERQSEKEKTDL